MAMKGATLKRVMMRPLMAPRNVPAASEMTMHHPGVRIDDDAEDGEVDALVDEQAGDDAGEAHDRADRQVDAAGQDDERHADAEDRVEGRLLDE